MWQWAQQQNNTNQIPTTNAKQNKKSSNSSFNLLNYAVKEPSKNVMGFSSGPFNMNQQSQAPQAPVSASVLKQLWDQFNKIKGGQ